MNGVRHETAKVEVTLPLDDLFWLSNQAHKQDSTVSAWIAEAVRQRLQREREEAFAWLKETFDIDEDSPQWQEALRQAEESLGVRRDPEHDETRPADDQR